MAKTKEQIIEELENVICEQEVQNMRIMDVLSSALDYVSSSCDIRAEQAEQSKQHDEKEKQE